MPLLFDEYGRMAEVTVNDALALCKAELAARDDKLRATLKGLAAWGDQPCYRVSKGTVKACLSTLTE